MATKNRLICVKQAIDCYLAQDYLNRELVIVSEGQPFYRDAIERYIARFQRNDIRQIYVGAGPYTLGQIRNIALSEAHGDIFCQWDDDDLYAPQRLSEQSEYMLNRSSPACCFNDQLQFFQDMRELTWINWNQAHLDPIHRLIPGTLMMHRDRTIRYPEDGPHASTGEDSAILEQLASHADIAGFEGAGHLYVYRFHGANTFDEAHHREIQSNYAVDAGFIDQNINALVSALQHFRLPRPVTIKVANDLEYTVL